MAKDPKCHTCLLLCHQTPLKSIPLKTGREDAVHVEQSPPSVWSTGAHSAMRAVRADGYVRDPRVRTGESGCGAQQGTTGTLSQKACTTCPWGHKSQTPSRLTSFEENGHPTLNQNVYTRRNGVHLFYFWLLVTKTVCPLWPCIWTRPQTGHLLQLRVFKGYCALLFSAEKFYLFILMEQWFESWDRRKVRGSP